MNHHSGLFPLGQVVSTPGASDALEKAGQSPIEFIQRHQAGDWSEMDEHDQQENQRSVEQGLRILSSYSLNNGQKLWLITEWDRSVTTLLLPSDY